MNRLYLVEYNGENTQYGYDVNGNQIKMIHSNGMKSSYTFDGRNLLTGIINTSSDGTNKKYYYNYDAEGLLTEKKEPKGTTAYIYNGNKQLVSMTEPGGRETSYTYDKAGNRKSQKVQDGSDMTEISYTYNSQNRLTATVEKTAGSVISTAYHYDANGNQTSVVETDSATGTTKTDGYTYDELNQLTHIEGSDGSTADYTYYATGLRASKNVNGSTAVFTYDGTKLLSEQTGNAVRTNIYGTNMIATAGADVLYYQYNNHGDVISVLDQDGTVKNEYDYDAFGNAITEKETVSNPYRYAGYYQDSESGLYYLQSRYYNPRTARFLTEDTASGKYTDPLSLNKYTYCHNQPVTGYDPDGHFLHIVLGAAIGGVIGAASSLYAQRKEIGTGAYSYKKYWGSVAEGAITGGIAAATFGGSLAAGAAGTGVKTAAKFTVKEAAKKTVTNAVIGAGTGLAGNTANQFISKGVSNYDAAEAVASSTATAASFMGMGFMSGAASSAGSKAAQKVAGNAMKKAGAKAAGKAGTSILSKVMGAAVEGGILGSSSGFFSNTASQIVKVQAGEQDNYNPMSLATDTALGGIVGAGIGATLGAASAVDTAGGRSGSNISFRDMMTPEEAVRYDAYWEQGAGSFKNVTINGEKQEIIITSGDNINTRQRLQTSPGTRSIVDVKYGENGEMYYRETIFDKFGRRIGNNDFTDHGTPHVPSHINPHYHLNSPLDPQAHGKPTPGLHPDTP